MSVREDFKAWIEQQPEERVRKAYRLAMVLQEEEDGKQDDMLEEDRAWLEADLGGPLPPYEWGPEGPPKGKPVEYVPGVGVVVKGGKDVE